jgi:hypothetical protein
MKVSKSGDEFAAQDTAENPERQQEAIARMDPLSPDNLLRDIYRWGADFTFISLQNNLLRPHPAEETAAWKGAEVCW